MIPRHTRYGGSSGFDTRPGVVNIDPADPVRGEGGITVDLELVSKEAFSRAAALSGGNPISAWDMAAKSQGGPGSQVVQLAPPQPPQAAMGPLGAPLQNPTIGVAPVAPVSMADALQQPLQHDAGGGFIQMAPGAVAPGPYVVPHTNPSGRIIPRENESMNSPLSPAAMGMPAVAPLPVINPNVKTKEASVNMQHQPASWDGSAPTQLPVQPHPAAPVPVQTFAPPPTFVPPPVPAPAPAAVPPQYVPAPAQYAPAPAPPQYAPAPAVAPAPVTQMPPVNYQPVAPQAPVPPPQPAVPEADPTQIMMLQAIQELAAQVKLLQGPPPQAEDLSDWGQTKQAMKEQPPESRLPEGVEYATADECGMPYLTTPPSRPSLEVIFDLGVGGIHKKRFHAVASNGQCISLFFDGRSDYDQFVPPDTDEEAHTIGLKIPSYKVNVRVKSFANNHIRQGCTDIINLIIWDQPADMGPPVATRETMQEISSLGNLADELPADAGGRNWN